MGISAKSFFLAALVAGASAFMPSRPVVSHRMATLSMADGSVEERVRELVKSQLDPDSDFEDSASFMDDLGADSLDAVELIMSLEEEFEIEIPDDEVEGITTVQAAIDFVKSKQRGFFVLRGTPASDRTDRGLSQTIHGGNFVVKVLKLAYIS